MPTSRSSKARSAGRALAGERTLTLEVCDDGAGLTRDFAPDGQAGLGLRNTRARLREHHPRDHELTVARREGGDTTVTVRLPLVRPRGTPG